MLFSHLSEAAQKKIIGLRTEYERALEKLERYYGHTIKVIQACTAEIRSHPEIASYNYKGMLYLKTFLENNYARLRCRKLEHEMSNTYIMEFILRKFPIQENVSLAKHLAETE